MRNTITINNELYHGNAIIQTQLIRLNYTDSFINNILLTGAIAWMAIIISGSIILLDKSVHLLVDK